MHADGFDKLLGPVSVIFCMRQTLCSGLRPILFPFSAEAKLFNGTRQN